MKKILSVFILLIFLSSCGTRQIYFSVSVPPLKNLHPDIKRLLVIDRTAEKNKKGALIEGILTGEGFDQDQKNKQEVLQGLEEQLSFSGRFKIIRAREILKGSKNGEVMSKALPQDTIKSLCEEYGADAVLALELYDSDFAITHGAKTSGGKFSFYAEGVAKVDLGFRMYDGEIKNLIDEYSMTHTLRWNVGGNSIQDALSSIIAKNQAIRDVSHAGGKAYARRLSPSSVRVSRLYYNRGNNRLEYAARMMEINDWDEAKKLLKKIANNDAAKTKHRGRAAHNLAVVYEIIDDISKAKEWAGIAWGQFENKDSRSYLYALNNRY